MLITRLSGRPRGQLAHYGNSLPIWSYLDLIPRHFDYWDQQVTTAIEHMDSSQYDIAVGFCKYFEDHYDEVRQLKSDVRLPSDPFFMGEVLGNLALSRLYQNIRAGLATPINIPSPTWRNIVPEPLVRKRNGEPFERRLHLPRHFLQGWPPIDAKHNASSAWYEVQDEEGSLFVYRSSKVDPVPQLESNIANYCASTDIPITEMETLFPHWPMNPN